MKLTATVKIKTSAPIYNGHRDKRRMPLFHCTLTHAGEVLADSGPWHRTEDAAIREALANLADLQHDVVREGYTPLEIDNRPDAWDQLHVGFEAPA